MSSPHTTAGPAERPEVWLLTHDGHNGGRIFSPLAALARLGCAVRLFHRVALPAGLAGVPDLRVPALTRSVIGLRRIPFPDCPFASVRRLVEGVRGGIAGLVRSGTVATLPNGWRARAGRIGGERILVLSNPTYHGALVGWLCYRERTDTLFYSNVGPEPATRSRVVLRTLHALAPTAPAIDPEMLAWCLEPGDDGTASLGGWAFTVGDGRYEAATGILRNTDGHLVEHVLAPSGAPVGGESLERLRLLWPNYDLAMEPLLRAESHTALEGAGRPPDLIIAADLPLLPYALALKERWGVPVVLDAHEWWAEQERTWNTGSGPGRAEALDTLERRCYPACDVRFTVGRTLARAMEERCGVSFDTLYTVADLAPASPARVPQDRGADRDVWWRTRCGFAPGVRVALFVGGLTTGRNLDALALASAHLRDDQALVVAGDGPYRTRLAQAVAARGRPERLRMLGEQSFDACLELLANADVAVIPYDPAESANPAYFALSVPAKFSDYLLCRVPVLVHAGMSECAGIVEESGVGRIWGRPGTASFGEALADMLADTRSLASMRAAYDRLPDLFSHRHLERVLEGVLRTCIDGLGRRCEPGPYAGGLGRPAKP